MNRTLISILLAGLFGLYSGSANAGSFNDNGNSTVTDLTTNLIWRQCSAGQSGADCATGTAATYTWEAAISNCEGLSLGGFTDWRLPNVKELKSIADMTTVSPAINTTYFPNTISSYYWSSTTYAGGATNAWYVNFLDGNTNRPDKINTFYVRCVRGQ